MTKEELLNLLNGKETKEVYDNYLELEKSIIESNKLYKYFDDLKLLLYSEKAFIRLRAFRLICLMSEYDIDSKIDIIIKELLNILDDDLPSVVRQCLQVIPTLLDNKPNLKNIILNKLDYLNLNKYKDTMKPLIIKDIKKIKDREETRDVI